MKLLAKKEETLDYQEYLEKIKDLASKVSEPSSGETYPDSIKTRAKQALYDNLDKNEELANVIDQAILENKLDGWRDGGIKEKKLRLAIYEIIGDQNKTFEIMEIIKAQSEY